MAEQKPRNYRAVVLIEGPDGQRHAYEIGDSAGIPFTFSRDMQGRIEVSGLFLGGAVWTEPMPDIALREIAPQ